MKFVLFCEGNTERKALPTFLKRWLDPRLSQRVGIAPVKFDGWRALYDGARKKALLRLREDDVIAVISLLDLYGPTIYPDSARTATERYDWAKKYIEEQVDHPKFRQFFAVHEVEAWLLSKPDLFPTEIQRGFPGRSRNPETVNFDEPPAKLLNRLHIATTRRTYKKVTQGMELFDRLDPAVAYEKCPRLKEMLDDMLRLAKTAGFGVV